MREIERMVSGHEKDDRPGSHKKERLERHRLVYEVSGETKGVVAQARQKLTKTLGRSVTDDELLQHLARRELEDEGGQGDGRQSRNRIHYEVCPKCEEGAQVVGGEAIPVDAPTVERVRCDAKARGTHAGTRARQRPSPAQREAKMKEQRFGCAVPGCTNSVWLEDHHEDLVSEGGTNDPKRRVALCWTHHDARHRGQLLIEGNAEGGWRFFHADGSPYGQMPDPNRADVFGIARDILRKMGFKDREAKQALTDCRAHVGSRPTVEEVVAAGLRAVPDVHGAKRYGRSAEPTSGARESLAPYRAFDGGVRAVDDQRTGQCTPHKARLQAHRYAHRLPDRGPPGPGRPPSRTSHRRVAPTPRRRVRTGFRVEGQLGSNHTPDRLPARL